MYSRDKRNSWHHVFLESLRDTGLVYCAARKAGVSRKMVYKARETSPEFRQDWVDAIELANAELERCMYKRAIDPDNRETALTIFLAKKRMPEIYGDRSEDDLGEPIDIPPVRAPADIDVAINAILNAYNSGEATGRRVDRMMAILRERREAMVATDLERQIADLRAAVEAKKQTSPEAEQ